MLFFFKQKTAYEMRISDWSSDVCSSDLLELGWQEIELPLTTEDDLHGFDRGRPTAVAREDEAQPDIATRRGGDVEVEPCRIVVARGPLCWFAVDRKSTRLNSSH